MADYKFNLLSPKVNFSIKVEGIVETLRKFGALDENVRREVDEMMSNVVDDWQKEIYQRL